MDMRAVRGLAEANARLDFLPKAAIEQLGVEIGIIANDVLAAQRRDVAHDTGNLRGALTMQVQIERLRARVGLIGQRARSKSSRRRAQQGKSVGRSYGNAFYGRFVEFGRRAQTVAVTRRLKRRIRGNIGATNRIRRRGPNKGTPVGDPYKVRMTALPARPFVHKDRPEHKFERRIAASWAGLMARG